MSQADLRPRVAVDAHGRLIPLSEEEHRRRAEEGMRALEAVLDMGDEDEQRETLDALMRAIDEDRLSSRKRFR
jgi:hypothetical protein